MKTWTNNLYVWINTKQVSGPMHAEEEGGTRAPKKVMVFAWEAHRIMLFEKNKNGLRIYFNDRCGGCCKGLVIESIKIIMRNVMVTIIL